MKLNITLDGKKYEVDVEAVEPTAPQPAMRGIPWDPQRASSRSAGAGAGCSGQQACR
jgi:hypothetical protein